MPVLQREDHRYPRESDHAVDALALPHVPGHLDHRIGSGGLSETATMVSQRSTDHVKDWRSIGTTHRRRDEAEAGVAHAQIERDTSRSTSALARWPAIVSAITDVVAAYNSGVGRERLVISEATDDQQRPSLTIDSTSPVNPALVLTLDHAEIRVEQRSTQADAGGIQRWVDLSRTDADTAAYVLQDWIEHL